MLDSNNNEYDINAAYMLFCSFDCLNNLLASGLIKDEEFSEKGFNLVKRLRILDRFFQNWMIERNESLAKELANETEDKLNDFRDYLNEIHEKLMSDLI